jgi:hypothetical protein
VDDGTERDKVRKYFYIIIWNNGAGRRWRQRDKVRKYYLERSGTEWKGKPRKRYRDGGR